MSKLYLIPNIIAEEEQLFFPEKDEITKLRIFFVEEIKSARRLLRKIDPQFPIDASKFFDLNEHTLSREARRDFESVQGQDIGVISEAGCPCVADPGSDVVFWGHQAGYEILPLVGPSSILLALMASGLNGQNFAFNGYLPKEKSERTKKLKDLEARSKKEGQTQLFMEAPYRSQALFEDILQVCFPNTRLCVASGLLSSSQSVKTKDIQAWRKQGQPLGKLPTIFLLEQS